MIFRRTGTLLILLLLFSGCGSSDADRDSTTYTDDLDRTVSLTPPINRAVSLAPNLTELVFAAGAGSTLVAVTTADDYPPAVDTLDRVGTLPTNFESIAAKEPDLVLATDQINPPDDTETFETLDIPIYFFSFATLQDVFDALRTMGTLFNNESVAQQRAQALEREVERLRSCTAEIPSSERPRVLVLVGDDTLYSFGQGSYIHTLVDLAGGRSITASLENEAPTLSEEYVLTEKPDVIVGAWGSNYNPDRLLELHPTWDVVPALQNERVYSLPPSLLLRPGPRLVKGAWQMAAHLHPSRFRNRPPKSSSDSTSRSSPTDRLACS